MKINDSVNFKGKLWKYSKFLSQHLQCSSSPKMASHRMDRKSPKVVPLLLCNRKALKKTNCQRKGSLYLEQKYKHCMGKNPLSWPSSHSVPFSAELLIPVLFSFQYERQTVFILGIIRDSTESLCFTFYPVKDWAEIWETF